MKRFLSKNYRHLGNAGDKAKTDIEAILESEGWQNAGLPQLRSTNSLRAYFHTLASVLLGVSRLRKGDTLLLQYPLKKYYDFVVAAARRRGARVVTLIHDLGSFRRKKLTVEEEVKRLNLSEAVIVHTPAMADWLRSRGVTAKLIVLGLFDYLSDSEASPHIGKRASRPRLAFAGGLSPKANAWLYSLAEAEPGIDIVAYGGGFDPSLGRENIFNKGFTDSDALIAGAEGDFGVAWYGSSLDEGAGPLGEYLRYNAPHKVSLYLRAGLPVIIWDKAGLADIVTRLGVGIAVPSLRGIERRISEISKEDYDAMRQRAAEVSRRLSKGEFTVDALRRLSL